MPKQIAMDVEGLGQIVEIELLEDIAPETCEAVWNALPMEAETIQAKFSGEMVFSENYGDDFIEVDQENYEYNAIPRDVGLWNSSWFDESEYDPGPRRTANQIPWTEIIFFYGRKAQLRHNLDDPIAMTRFGKIVGGFTPFSDLMRQVRIEGPKQYTLQRA